ncbi:MAG: NAD-dependent deacylase [Micrococcus sp.]|nr:NAD-dependent deacylase [Micrococcus sp.]
MPSTPLEQARALVAAARRPVILTGAGMSAESGVPTFREAQTGLWERFSAEDLATPEAFDDDPALVTEWYRWRERLIRSCTPNAGHEAIAAWQSQRAAAGDGPGVRVITQNVDDLHERAGTEVLAHLHGSIFAWRCADCEAPAPAEAERDPDGAAAATTTADGPATSTSELPKVRVCAVCGDGLIRPGVVWFGEMLPRPAWEAAHDALQDCDLVLVIGTSGLVQPAASLPFMATAHGARLIEVNPERTELSVAADVAVQDTAARVLPLLLAD